MRDVAASLVCHASVAENGVNETVWTSVIVGGGPVGVAGVVAVVVVVAVCAGAPVVTGGSVPLGKARKVSSRAYGASTPAAAEASLGMSPVLFSASDSPSTPESRCRPGEDVRPV